MRLRTAFAATALLALGGCAASEPAATDTQVQAPKKPAPDEVSRASMGNDWPLTVDEGRLVCIGSDGAGAVIFVGPDGMNYAVNGIAKEQMDAAPDIDRIWANDRKSGAGLKKDLDPLIQRGLDLC